MSSYSRSLREALVPLVADHKCSSPEVYGADISPNMFCAGYFDCKSDACQVCCCQALARVTQVAEHWNFLALPGLTGSLRQKVHPLWGAWHFLEGILAVGRELFKQMGESRHTQSPDKAPLSQQQLGPST